MNDISRLLKIMARLRDPNGGCPWDLQQNFASIAPYTVEEAYEVADAIERGDTDDLRDELGDLLLQVVFHAQMAKEQGLFDFADVVEAISDKMHRRHPHVFADEQIDSADQQNDAWEQAKAQERQKRKGGLLDDVPRALPGLKRAEKLTRRAASVGFDWPDLAGVRDKLTEELEELDAELAKFVEASENDAARAAQRLRVQDELGDVLFALSNLARHVKVDPEVALSSTTAKFVRRLGYVEAQLKQAGSSLEEATLAQMDHLWDEAKLLERSA